MSHPLYGQNIVFTGVLERMLRKEAAQLAANLGALCQNGVNKSTNILVLGNNDYNPLIKGGMSSKQKKAQEYILKGQDLIIISENVFYDMVTD
jgi:DNA polymerase-3 subunit epsilon